MSSYTEIVTFIQEYHEDDSAELLTSIPKMIAQAEDRIFNDVPNLIAFRSKETGTLTSGTSTLALTATDARELKTMSITVSSNMVFLEKRQEEYIQDYWPNAATTSQPKFFAQQSAADTGAITLLIGPTPDDNYAYTLNYGGQLSRLTSGNTPTFLSTVFPDVLKRACLYETALFLESEADVIGPLKGEYTEAKNMLAMTVEKGQME